MFSGGYTYQATSNPYRASYSSYAGGEATMGWTLGASVNTGLTSYVTTYNGAGFPSPFGGNGDSSGTVTTARDRVATTVTDQAGKQRRSITNALGQMERVDEPNLSNQLDVNGAPAQPTNYAYDLLNNLKTVVQGSQQRSFTYSSLSRLTSANNPESGTITYGYDNNGNLTSKTDDRGVTATYQYDELNRVTTRSYNNTITPPVSYTYDNVANAKGRLTKVSSSVSTTEYTSFDILGRVTESRQTTDGVTYGTGGTEPRLTTSR